MEFHGHLWRIKKIWQYYISLRYWPVWGLRILSYPSIGCSNCNDGSSPHHPREWIPHKPQKLEYFVLLHHKREIIRRALKLLASCIMQQLWSYGSNHACTPGGWFPQLNGIIELQNPTEIVKGGSMPFAFRRVASNWMRNFFLKFGWSLILRQQYSRAASRKAIIYSPEIMDVVPKIYTHRFLLELVETENLQADLALLGGQALLGTS